MRILVTGAAGFIGSRVCAMLAGEHEVFAFCRRPAGLPGCKDILGDLAADPRPSALPKRIDAVIHLAQSGRYREFPLGAADMFAVNVNATAKLLEYALECGASSFLLASTGTVYEPYDKPLEEAAAIAPTGCYGATKAAAEYLIAPYRGALNACALRLFAPYGPGQVDRLVPSIVQRICQGRAVSLGGRSDGLVLTPTYVDDVAAVVVAAVTQRWNDTVNVASPEALSLRTLAEVIACQLGVPVSFEQTGGQEPPRLVPDLTRLAMRFPLDRFRSFEQGLKETLRAEYASRGSAKA